MLTAYHGLVRHLAGVERWWFQINFAGEDVPMLYYSEQDPDQDFEYARHNGHADLLREGIDGATGH